MIPSFLNEFAEDLMNLEREFIKISVNPIDVDPRLDGLEIYQSKFLGTPFFPRHEVYPYDNSNQPMLLAAQINFAELPKNQLLPEGGLLQLYLSSSDWYEEGYKVFYWEKKDLEKEHIKDFSFISLELYKELPIYKVHELIFQLDIDKGGSEDCQFDFMFGEKGDYWSFFESLSDIQQEEFEEYFNADGHKIGGFASFTQSDPRDYNKDQKSDIQILQIDTDQEIMFGDSGIGHLFINPADLAERRFERAYFYWDCC